MPVSSQKMDSIEGVKYITHSTISRLSTLPFSAFCRTPGCSGDGAMSVRVVRSLLALETMLVVQPSKLDSSRLRGHYIRHRTGALQGRLRSRRGCGRPKELRPDNSLVTSDTFGWLMNTCSAHFNNKRFPARVIEVNESIHRKEECGSWCW